MDRAPGDGTPQPALKVAAVVGMELMATNQGDVILAGIGLILWSMVLTCIVPCCVATDGAVTAKRAMLRPHRRGG